jgi:hypothetical protein
LVPPSKLSVMVDPLSWPATEMVWVETDAFGGVPDRVSTWAEPEMCWPDRVHWMKMTASFPLARYPDPTALAAGGLLDELFE